MQVSVRAPREACQTRIAVPHGRNGRHDAGIIAAMTERGLPSADASPACPFVAFERRPRRARRPTRPPPSLLRRGPARAARRRAPGGVLPVERLPGLPGVPDVGSSRGRPGTGRPSRRGRRGRLPPEPQPARPRSGSPAAPPSRRRWRAADGRTDVPVEATPAQPAARLGGAATVGDRARPRGAAAARSSAPGGGRGDGARPAGSSSRRRGEGQGLVGSPADRVARGGVASLDRAVDRAGSGARRPGRRGAAAARPRRRTRGSRPSGPPNAMRRWPRTPAP